MTTENQPPITNIKRHDDNLNTAEALTFRLIDNLCDVLDQFTQEECRIRGFSPTEEAEIVKMAVLNFASIVVEKIKDHMILPPDNDDFIQHCIRLFSARFTDEGCNHVLN